MRAAVATATTVSRCSTASATAGKRNAVQPRATAQLLQAAQHELVKGGGGVHVGTAVGLWVGRRGGLLAPPFQ